MSHDAAGRPGGEIAKDVREAYEESDQPLTKSRDRAADAERHAERSGQAEDPPGADDRGTGALEDREG